MQDTFPSTHGSIDLVYHIRNVVLTGIVITAMVLFSAVDASPQDKTEGMMLLNEGVFEPGTIRTLIESFQFGEGPVQTPDGDIFVCEKNAFRYVRISLDGDILERIDSPGGCNGLAADSDGNLYICAQASRQILRRTPDGTVEVIVDSFNGQPFTYPNDIWLAPGGGFYFTDPDYSAKDSSNTVYYMEPDLKTLHLVNDDMPSPNGIIGSPDGRTLYVTNFTYDDEAETYAFDIEPDGMLANKRFFTTDGVDGTTIDREGNIYLTGQTLTVYSPEGVKIGEIDFPEDRMLSNCALVGPDKRTLLVTGWTGVYSVRTTIPGL